MHWSADAKICCLNNIILLQLIKFIFTQKATQLLNH